MSEYKSELLDLGGVMHSTEGHCSYKLNNRGRLVSPQVVYSHWRITKGSAR